MHPSTQAINTVGVIGREDAGDCIPVLTALARSCGLNLRRVPVNEAGDLTALILLGASADHPGAQVLRGRPSIRVFTSEVATDAGDVCFGNGPSSPGPFKGRSLVTGSTLPGDPHDVSGEVIATADGRPVWTTVSEGGLRQDTCWVSRPWIKKGECVFDHLNGSRFMNLLPLLEWLRWISDWRKWEQPRLQACFIFDDPNLHSTRYGFVGFQQLAVEGRRNHYHTAFATVPLDSYYVNPAAARIIRDNRETLSLLIHGNNHTYRELTNREAPPERLALMQQAIRRTCKLERKAGVAVSRVMAPPHGVCSAGMMAAMVGAGFEAVCVSHGSVWTGNPGAEWTVSLGTQPATVVAGLPVIPRFGLDRKPENKIFLAAYLNQPIIPVGHHWDLAEGMDILSSAARFINGLGTVAWSDLSEITRNNYRFRIQGRVMRIHTFSRITTVNVPEGVSELEFEAPWLDPVRECVECRSSGNGAQPPFDGVPSAGLRFGVNPGSIVELVVLRTPSNGEHPHAPPKTPLGVVARRVLVEMRDRGMPYLPRRFVKR